MGSRYWELAVPVSDDLGEGLTNFVWELGALGTVEEQSAGPSTTLRAFFPAGAAPGDLAARVSAYLASLRRLGFAVAGEPRVTEIADAGWAEAWRQHFRPLPVGRRLLVAPPWAEPAADGRLVLTIEPGRAFGTGQHGSTAGCLAALEAVLGRGVVPRALDLGTGSGILAVAAARLGVGAVVAVDHDPDAIAAAVANAARNHVADRVRCVLTDVRALAAEPAPLVMANLLTASHLQLAAHYRRWVLPGGTLLAGGILDAEADQAAAALGAAGFVRRDTVARDGWITLALRREGGPGDAPVRDRA